MLHDLARVEINKLEAHGITGLSYDEIASLQMAAVAVDQAAKSEGLAVGLPRPMRLTDEVILWPMTLAAQQLPDVTRIKNDARWEPSIAVEKIQLNLRGRRRRFRSTSPSADRRSPVPQR